jgi:glycosyltransferase involved in cell wall biosynthesis
VSNELFPYHFGPGSPFVISYAGSLGSGYDILTIIEAAVILEQRFPGFFIFKIAGGGQKSILFDQIHTKNIFFLGYLSSSEVRAVLSSSNLMLLPYAPNSAVAMPIKFFDAFNLQLPVVSSLGLEAFDLISRYKIGAYYQAQNPESLAQAVINICEDYQFYSQNTREFYDRFSGVFSSSGTYDKFAVELMH